MRRSLPEVGEPRSSSTTIEDPESRPGLSLLISIPCLNEEQTVGRIVNEIPRHIPGIDRIDVVVIDDGSVDRTAELAREAGAEVIRHRTNRGLGPTFRAAVETALCRGADILVNIDGDAQFDPNHIPALVAPIVEHAADMVTASRFLDRDLVPEMPAVKRWGNRGVARIVWLLTGQRFRDVSCGFRAFSREALLRMNLFGGFTYTQESFLDLAFKDLPILEVPVKVRGTREFGKSRISSNIPRYAVRSLQIMLRAFISYRPFSFFSAIAAVFLVFGFSLLLFLTIHYLQNRSFSPYIWVGFVGGSLSFLGIITLVIGFLGDMLVRVRMNQERILYTLKTHSWRGTHRSKDAAELPLHQPTEP
jgi:glycosyltransferase involved in cell wall biosynthesis